VLLVHAVVSVAPASMEPVAARHAAFAQHLDDQVDQALCLTLVTNAAVLWTTTYLGYALDAPRRT
jgi:hypothetical protein